MFGWGTNPFVDADAIYYLYTNAILFVALIICSTPLLKNMAVKLQEKAKITSGIAVPVLFTLLLFICTAYLVNLSYNPFLYFRF